MKKLLLLTKTLLAAVCLLVGATNAWGVDEIVSWSVSSAPTGGALFKVNSSDNTEGVLQVAFGTPASADSWTVSSSAVNVTYKGNNYNFANYAVTSNTNGSSSSSLAADGSSENNYIAFVPKYDGTLIIVGHNLGTGNTEKPTWCYEDGEVKSGVIIGTGSSDIAYDGKTDVNTLNGGQLTGGIKLSVKAGSTYTLSIQGSKARWMGVIYEYTIPWKTLYKKSLSEWTDDDLTEWVPNNADYGTTSNTDESETKDKVTRSSNTTNGLYFNSYGHQNGGSEDSWPTIAATACNFTKSIETSNDTKILVNAVWNPGNSTGTSNNTNGFFQVGDIIFKFYGSNWKTKVKIGSADEVELSGVGTTRSRDYTVTIEIDQSTGAVNYSFTDNGKTVYGSGTSALTAGSFNSVKYGIGGKMPNWSLDSKIKSITVKETSKLKLIAPTYTKGNLKEPVADGPYYFNYSVLSENDGSLETYPEAAEITYKYQINDGEIQTASGAEFVLQATGAATAKVWATAYGYTDSEKTEISTDVADYQITSYYPFGQAGGYALSGTKLTSTSSSDKVYTAVNGLYAYTTDSKNSLTLQVTSGYGLNYTSNATNPGYIGLSQALTGQYVATNVTNNSGTKGGYTTPTAVVDNSWVINRYHATSARSYRDNSIAELRVLTPSNLIATASDVTVTDGVVDLTGKVIYEGNLTEIKNAIAALEGVKTIKVGQVGCAVTAAQLNGLIPTTATNTIFVQLPENSYYEVATDVANLRTHAGTVAKYVLADANDYAVANSFTATSATYDRSFNKDVVSTVCLPFAIDNSEGTLGTFYQLKNTTTTEKVVFEEVATTEALKPYLFVPAATGTITIPENTAFAAATTPTSTTINNVTFNGSIASSEISSQIYGFKADGTFVTASDGTMNPFRAYLTTSLGSGARLARWSFGEITDIDGVKVNVKQEEVHIYNLQGQEVKSPRKGNVYIMNGKKVIF